MTILEGDIPDGVVLCAQGGHHDAAVGVVVVGVLLDPEAAVPQPHAAGGLDVEVAAADVAEEALADVRELAAGTVLHAGPGAELKCATFCNLD